MDPFGAGTALHRSALPEHFLRALNSKDEARIRMNVAAHQGKNEKRGKKEKKQSIDFKVAACCPSTVVQRAAR